MIVFPNAKINIGLRITGERSDGYHDIETIFYPVWLSDALEFVATDQPVNKDILVVTGINTGSSPEDNLIIKTLKKLREKHSFPYLKMHLHKAIPVGSGLGGGSSDAACLLKVINKRFGLNLNSQDLKDIALQMGSDCPFFIDCLPSMASGRGEILTPVREVLAGYYLVLINPGVGISTREAYQNCRTGPASTSLRQLYEQPVSEWEGSVINDFEDFAFKKYPVIRDIKRGLYQSNAIFALMSGSGSSVYGIFSQRPELPEKLRDIVIWEGVI